MSTTYPHPRSVLVQLAELTGGNLYAVRYEALRLLSLDVPSWPDCRKPQNRALRRLALDCEAPARMRLAAIKTLWGLSLDTQERQQTGLRAIKRAAAREKPPRRYTKTDRWYASRGEATAAPTPGDTSACPTA